MFDRILNASQSMDIVMKNHGLSKNPGYFDPKYGKTSFTANLPRRVFKFH